MSLAMASEDPHRCNIHNPTQPNANAVRSRPLVQSTVSPNQAAPASPFKPKARSNTASTAVLSNKSGSTIVAVHNDMDSRFSCNICLDPVEEPVVTQCGHLYCWPCLFRWLEPGMTLTERQSLDLPSMVVLESHHDESRRFCPVCKAGCCVSNLIPIYVKAATPHQGVERGGGVAATAAAVAANASEKQQLEEEEQQQHHHHDSIDHLERFREQSRNNISDLDDKHSSNSTIATEQEDDDEDGEPVGAPILDSASPTILTMDQVQQEEEASGQQPVLSMDSGIYDDTSSSVRGAPPAAALGALQRQRRSSPSPPPFPISATLVVPSRPSSVRPRAFSENAVGILQQQERQQQEGNIHTHLSRTLAMSQGLAMTLHRALQPTGSTNSTAQAAAAAAASVVVPPLHRAEGFGNAAAMNRAVSHESDPDATEFLSRILLMLASFVIFCLLLF